MKQHWRNVRPAVLPVPIYLLARLIGMTVRIKSEGYEEVKALPGGKIMAGWHGRTFLATQFFRNKGVWTIISQSKDGDMQDAIFRRFGFKTIRGSTGRGGMKAAIESIRVLKDGATMAFTPDGPRGPSGVVQEGIMLMARKSGAAIVPVGVAAEPCWHARTWDRYMVPKPFARGIMVFGDPIYVPADVSAEDQEAIRSRFEREMHRLEAYAEDCLRAK
ncbi:MAG: lysophospholipid acyltransferase family protein [Fimbriimonadaceae bacterium]|nr:lysophospholipid acyltransferase family protein [Fimbriimonadaceae bacterium]